MRNINVIFAILSCAIWKNVSCQFEPDDAVVIEAGDGDITPADGPDGPSLIGSVDNVFKAVKDYDQFRCIERMICEAMSENTDIPGIDGLVSAITGEDPGPAVAASIAEGFGGGRPPFQGQGSSSGGLFSTIESFIGGGNSGGGQFGGGQASSGGGFLNTLENLVFGTRRTDSPPPPQRPFRPPQRPFSRPPQRPVRRRPPPNRRPIPQNQFFGRRQDESGFRPSQQLHPRRSKRQTRLQGNIIRLAQATGMDKYNAFPYVRAALIGQATQSRNPGNRVTRRGSACSQLYKDCPTDSNSLLNYFNNHNGGLVNNVQPSVDSEVAPLIQAIIADVVGPGDNGGGSRPETAASTAESEGSFLTSGLFQGADALFTNAVINQATEAFAGGSGSGGFVDSILDPIVDTLWSKK